ncbi:hypothetical protein LTR64_002456 [Lithohypha guttulata]|uniref:uncharacterized protein n=1 Tax=Lithohypha guttulata TaxID=1690604 RepID=UPI002DDDF4EE|nr:hypothetical protein LTR51_001318 [Lithohypha guttulata]
MPSRSEAAKSQEHSPEGANGSRTSSGTLNEQRENHEENDRSKQEDDQGQEEKGQSGPPPPVGFFDKRLHATRIDVAKKYVLTTIILMVFILCVLSLYWAVLFRVEENMSALTAIVVDFDGQSAPYQNVQPIVGPALTQAARQTRMPTGTIGWEVMNPARFNFDPIAVRQYIYDEHAWVAVIINNNATALLRAAVQTGNVSYDPLGAAQIVYVQARDETTYANYILPQVQQFQTMVTTMVGSQWTSQVLGDASLNPATYSTVPQALSPAIGFSTFNLRPFLPTTATPAVTIGLIYLIILAFFSFGFYLPIYSQFVIPKGHPPMHFWELMLWRLGMVILTYFFLSLAYSLVSLSFQIPFSNTFPHNDVTVANIPNAYGKGTFVVYWMLNWTGMAALGLASENVTMLIGQPWTALWLIFWVITNVSTSFYAIPLEPGFFKWGYAWPLHNIVEASRTILFDTHSRIGLNFGVLFAWVGINIIVFFPAAVFFRWKNTKEQMKQVPRSNLQWLLDG